MTRFDALIGAVRQQQVESSTEDVQESKHSDISTSKSKDANYQRTTVYLPKDLHRQFKMAALAQDLEMSAVVEELIRDWLQNQSDAASE